MTREIEILIDDDKILGDDYCIDEPMSEATRRLMMDEFRKIVVERQSDLEQLRNEKGPILFDPENLDLEVKDD